jgi:diguanylate cyclase (GGDEF)-like protein/PAS domain S-box-containing protein
MKNLTNLSSTAQHGTAGATAQPTLHRSEGWMHAAVDENFDAFLLLRPIFDGSGKVVDCELLDLNRRAEALLEAARPRLLGRRLSKVLHAHHRELVPRYAAVLENGAAREEQFPLAAPSGRTFWVRHRVTLVADGIAVLWRDVTGEVETLHREQANETNYRELLGSLQEGIWVTDAEARTVFVSLPMARMLGYAPEQMYGRSIFEFVSDVWVAPLRDRFARRRRGIRERYEFEFRRANGEPIFLELEAGPRSDATGAFIGTIVGVVDVTERRRTEERLRTSLARLERAEKLAALGSWSYDPMRRTFFAGSPGLQRLLGFSAGIGEIPAQVIVDRFPVQERAGVQRALEAIHRGETQRNEHCMRTASGEVRVLLFHCEPVLDAEGRVVRVDGFTQDVTERRRYEERLEHLASHDALTGLPNRRVLEDRIAQSIAHLERRPGEFLAILYLDLDDFKLVNDRLGHACGDELLKRVGQVLRGTVREGDTVARLGGDEFILLLRHIRQRADVELVAEKILQSLGDPANVSGHELNIACSIGASIYPTDGQDAETLLKNADAAMYVAKHAGGGVRFHGPARDFACEA